MHETISSPEPRRFVRTFGLDLQAVKHALGPEPMLTAPPVVGLDELLLSMADDEFVIGFSDSEWTGIAPILEEDVAMSSLSQDELGHAAALYALLAGISDTDADAIAYDRQPEAYRHARLLDHGRSDWAMTIARRYLYETADAVRLEALAGGAWSPLAELVGKLQREERYHQMHVESWLARLASSPGEPRDRLIQALGALGPDAGTVFTPLAGERELIDGGVLARPITDLELDWRSRVATAFGPLDLPLPPPTVDRDRGRRVHAEPFHWLWTEFTTVRQSDPGATW